MKGSATACRAIRAASTESQVIQAVSEYLKSLEPGVLALLPAGLATIGSSHAEEIIHSALQLTQRRIARSKKSPEARTLSDIVLVLSAAARRLATLAKKA